MPASRPNLGSSARLLFAAVAAAFLLYSLLLYVFAVMAVHQVSAGKAIVCVALMAVFLPFALGLPMLHKRRWRN